MGVIGWCCYCRCEEDVEREDQLDWWPSKDYIRKRRLPWRPVLRALFAVRLLTTIHTLDDQRHNHRMRNWQTFQWTCPRQWRLINAKKLERSRIASLRSIPEEEVFEKVLGHSIVDDLIAAHRCHPNRKVKFVVEGEEAVGDGVHRDDGFDGTDEQVPNHHHEQSSDPGRER